MDEAEEKEREEEEKAFGAKLEEDQINEANVAQIQPVCEVKCECPCSNHRKEDDDTISEINRLNQGK